MIYKVFSIRDRASSAYAQPFYMASIGAAIRAFSDEINRVDANNSLNKHPEDFDLFYLAEFDDNTGEFTGLRPEQVAVGKDVAV